MAEDLAKALTYNGIAKSQLKSLDPNMTSAAATCGRAAALMPAGAAAFVCHARAAQHVGEAGGDCPAAGSGSSNCLEASLDSYVQAMALNAAYKADWTMWRDMGRVAVTVGQADAATGYFDGAVKAAEAKFRDPQERSQVVANIEVARAAKGKSEL